MVSTGRKGGALPAKQSFVSVDNEDFIVTALKSAEDGDGAILRG
jgi:alpha-mannosidase